MAKFIIAAAMIFLAVPQMASAASKLEACEELAEDFPISLEAAVLQGEPLQNLHRNLSFDDGALNSPQGIGFDQALQVSVDKLVKFNPSIQSKVYQARKLLETIFDSQEFYDAVINYTYKNRKQFLKNQGYSNLEIYNRIQLGQEKRTTVADQLMNLHLVLYYADDNVAGKTNLFASPIYVNSKFYKTYDLAEVARNLSHEWLHNMGFSHSGLSQSQLRHSVPYAIGNIVEKLARR